MGALSLELRHEIVDLIQHEIKDLKSLDERLNTLELELKHQRELMNTGFSLMEKRFEDNRYYMEKRFEESKFYMEKRFESVDKRFEQVNKRINLQTWIIGFGFTVITVLMSLYRFFG